MPSLLLPSLRLRLVLAQAVVPWLACGGFPAARAQISVTLDPPDRALPAGSTYTFSPTLTGTQDRGQLDWELLENGHRARPSWVCSRDQELAKRPDSRYGRAMFLAPAGTQHRVFQVRVSSRLNPEASAEVTVQVEPRTPAPARPAAPPRYLWQLPCPPPDVRLWPRNLAWDPGSWSLLVTDHQGQRVVRVGLDRPGMETVASAVERPGQAPVVQDGSAFRGGFEILGGSVAVHPHGGVVVADQGNHRIRWIREGTVTTLAGTGAPGFDGDLDRAGQEWPAAQARIHTPSGVVVTPEGEVVFSDTRNQRVRKITRRGTLVTLAGPQGPAEGAPPLVSGPGWRGGVEEPLSMALAPDGRILFVDCCLIRAIEAQGALHTLAGNGRRGWFEDQEDARRAGLDHPMGLAVASDGSVLFCECNLVRKVTPDHRLVTLAGAQAGEPAVPGYSRLVRMIRDLKAWWKGTPFPVPADQDGMGWPRSLCVLPGGSLVVLDASGLRFLGPGGAGEQALVDLVQRAWDHIQARDRAGVARILASLDRWAQVPKPPGEMLQLGLAGCAKAGAGAGLPGLPLRLQVAQLGPLLVGGEKEQGLALQARVAGAFIRHALEAWTLPVPAMLEGKPEGEARIGP